MVVAAGPGTAEASATDENAGIRQQHRTAVVGAGGPEVRVPFEGLRDWIEELCMV